MTHLLAEITLRFCSELLRQNVGIPMRNKCAPLVAFFYFGIRETMYCHKLPILSWWGLFYVLFCPGFVCFLVLWSCHWGRESWLFHLLHSCFLGLFVCALCLFLAAILPCQTHLHFRKLTHHVRIKRRQRVRAPPPFPMKNHKNIVFSNIGPDPLKITKIHVPRQHSMLDNHHRPMMARL